MSESYDSSASSSIHQYSATGKECKYLHSTAGEILRSVSSLPRARTLQLHVCQTALEWRCALQISPGGQGFRSDLPNSTWYNNGLTGEDYVGLMSIPEIAFGTVHFCEPLTLPAMFLAVLRRPAPACIAVHDAADPLNGGCNMRMQCKPQQATVALPQSAATGAFPAPGKSYAST